jgi:hypothetical protein
MEAARDPLSTSEFDAPRSINRQAVPRHVAGSDGDRARAAVGARLQAERFRYGGRAPADAVVRTRCCALVGANSLVAIPAEFDIWIVAATTFLLSVALAAMGLETDIRK